MSMLSGATTLSKTGVRSIPIRDRDARLQLSRRVDWRFLLPQPELAETAYFGQLDAELVESLQQFTSKLTLVEDSPIDSQSDSGFPLTVLSNPTFDELNRAIRLTQSGGFVYVEVNRGQHRPRPSSNALHGLSIRGFVAEMRKLQLSEVRVHWHWPSFESCTEMIPFDDRAAIICALRRRGSGTASRWKARAARVLLECRLLEKVVSCFSVLGRKL